MKIKDPKSVARWGKNQVWLTLIPSLMIEALFNTDELPDLDDDWEEWAKWSAGSIGKLVGGGLVGVRDLANAFASGYGYQITPLGNVGKAAFNTFQQAKQGDMDAAAFKAGVMLAFYVARLPGGRAIARAGDVLYDEGAEALETFEGWWRLLAIGPERKK